MKNQNEEEWSNHTQDFIKKSVLVVLNSRINLLSDNEYEISKINKKVKNNILNDSLKHLSLRNTT